MQRWYLTVGLAGVAIAAAAIAPNLGGWRTTPLLPAPTPTSTTPPTAMTPPESDGHVSVEVGLDWTALLAEDTSERFLTITLTGDPDAGERVRRPLNVAVVLDASGSMAARGKMDYARSAATLLVDAMDPNDSYALVTFADDATTVVPSSSVSERKAVRRAIARVLEGGGTNLYGGLLKGADEVRRTLDGAEVGRVILLSDGNANVGITDPGALERLAGDLSADGVSLSTVGLGMDYNEDVLAGLADLGGGSYDFVGDPQELATAFHDELERSARVVARNTEVILDLPPHVELVEVIGWDVKLFEEGYAVQVGEIYADDAKKIVARVRVTTAEAGQIQVGTVRAHYRDLVDGQRHASGAIASATVTRDHALLGSSVDRDNRIESTKAMGNWYLNESVKAFEQGQIIHAQELVQQGNAVLLEAAESLGDADLANEAKVLDAQAATYGRVAPSSEDGRRAIKSGKERFLEKARTKK